MNNNRIALQNLDETAKTLQALKAIPADAYNNCMKVGLANRIMNEGENYLLITSIFKPL